MPHPLPVSPEVLQNCYMYIIEHKNVQKENLMVTIILYIEFSLIRACPLPVLQEETKL